MIGETMVVPRVRVLYYTDRISVVAAQITRYLASLS